MVIENHPVLDDGSPFPTLYWLTCPILCRRASALESEGRMKDVNDVLGARPDLRASVAVANERLEARRDAHQRIPDSSAPPGGGPERVKCLHAHLAQELADPPNPIGSLTLADAGWPDCRVACVEVDQ